MIRKPSVASKGEILVVISRFISSTLVALVAVCAVGGSFAQQPAAPGPAANQAKPAPTPTPTPTPNVSAKDAMKNPTAELIVESTIYIYGLGGGRQILNQIRKTALERGKVSIANAEGKMDQANYQRWTQRAETLNKERVRLDQEFPTARYSLIFNDQKVFGIVDDQVFTPREDATRAFENQIVHGLEALLRYKENDSKLALAGKEKIFGVEYYLIDVTDKQERKTRFYISTRSFRVMMLDYEQAGTKYRRKFYDYNYAQGTLVPFRTALFAGDKMIEETEVGTITFGQKIDEAMFAGT